MTASLRYSYAFIVSVCLASAGLSHTLAFEPRSTWPQFHKVSRLEAASRLEVSNKYYVVEHNLKGGGAISRIALTFGTSNLLVQPAVAQIIDAEGTAFSELNDQNPRVTTSREGLAEVLEVDSQLVNAAGAALQGVALKTRFEHHWGYIKVRKEFEVKGAEVRVRALTPFHAVFAPGLTSYGYREGVTEEEGAGAFSFGSCRWGHLGDGRDVAVATNYLPRYVMCAEPSVQGIEWFMGSDLHQWDLQVTNKRGAGECELKLGGETQGIVLSVSALKSAEAVALKPGRLVFDYYLAVPLKEGHALKPWMHTSFNRNRGEWVNEEQVKRWKESGIQTVHCHNDGDYYDDGLFWRDGSYPPYPDMDRYNKVLTDCGAAGIRTATYFSNKELHRSTKEFQDHSQQWGRKNLKGNLQVNIYRGTNEFGAQMCLRSGWLDFLKESIDRVLRNHPLDGVYYDWNVALLCNNPLHEPKSKNAAEAAHWDIDELLQLMEWTRFRVGPSGMVIVHNTTTPMFVMENFADYIVANEWGYGKWSGDGPELSELPLEWSLVGARSRGVISYGQLDANSPRRLHRVFALQALVSGVSPWPVSPETLELFPILKPIGDLETCRFSDWRNEAVKLSGKRTACAIYSRADEAWLLVANTGKDEQVVECKLDPAKLPHPLKAPRRVTLEGQSKNALRAEPQRLDAQELTTSGVKLTIEGDSVVLLRVE